MRTIMKCFNTHSKLIAIIENVAISAITLHSKGIYIYWSKYYSYEPANPDFSVTKERAGHIICDYTIVENISDDVFEYFKEKHDVLIIENDLTIHDYAEQIKCDWRGMPKSTYIAIE